MASPILHDNFIFRFCTVEYVDDKSKGLRIKVRIPPYDNGKNITQEPSEENKYDGVPWCFPLLPKMMNVNPKVGEMVVVFCQQPNSAMSQRMFIGPVISQDYMMDFDYDFPTPTESWGMKSSARRLLTGSTADRCYTPFPNPDEDGYNKGTIPEREDIALRGRTNTDVVLKDNDVRIRCGFKTNPKSDTKTRLHFNDKDLSYILMRYRKGKDEVGDYKSSVNIVGDRINLLSHDSNTTFKLGDPQELITDEQMEQILSKAHELPYGDVLVDFLKCFIDVFKRHVHPFPGKEPSLSSTDVDSLSPNWNEMLSKSVRIN